MGTLPNNHIATAAPFNLINPSGIDPGQSLAALIQTAEGARNRSTQERMAGADRNAQLQSQQSSQQFQMAQQSQALAAQSAEAQKDRALQQQIANQRYGMEQSDREDQEFFRNQEGRLASISANLDAEMDQIN